MRVAFNVLRVGGIEFWKWDIILALNSRQNINPAYIVRMNEANYNLYRIGAILTLSKH